VKTNQSLARAFAVLEHITDHPGVRLKDVAHATGLAIPTAARFLANLEALGYLRCEANRWRVGSRLAGLGRGFLPSDAAAAIATALMELAEATGVTAFYVVCDRDEAVYVHRAAPTRAGLVSAQRIGTRAPLYCTGVGKVFLGARSDEAVREYARLRTFHPFTPHTVDSLPELLRRVELVRQQDWACDDEECELGLRCLAVPVRDHAGTLCAAISVSGSKDRLGAAPNEAQMRALRQAAAAVAPVAGAGVW
jgi:DNA-binding IclR family transcriptional regulator